VTAVAHLSAVYLVREASCDEDAQMTEYFRRRAVISAVVVAVVGVVGMFVLHDDARYIFDGLTSRALPVVIAGVICGLGALLLLARNAARGARVLAVIAVACVVFSWGVAQSPYLLPESLKVSAAAAPSGTLTALITTVAVAVIIVLPGFVLLYVLAQRHLLPEEGVEDLGDRTVSRRVE
jgi:cytochrome bd ubiquinol oxidase subunit II